jgi:crotonobetainyl-CoA:carnitine CoA-transferase CaiB-like acyl-CoA transferase
MVVDLKHPGGKSTKGPGNPIKLSRSNEESFSAAPLVGQHTQQILSALLEYDAQKIERLWQQGAVA